MSINYQFPLVLPLISFFGHSQIIELCLLMGLNFFFLLFLVNF